MIQDSSQIELETERLLIRPLTYDQLVQYIGLNGILEQCLGLELYPRSIPDELMEAFEQLILPQVAASDNYLYSTLWTMIDKNMRLMVGDLCFKGAPNEQGEVEVGYGTYEDFQGRGYMTEALGALSRWALDQPGVRTILAETDKGNPSSHRTLEKNGFRVFKEIERLIWWRLSK